MKLIKDLGRQYQTENSKQKKLFGVYECPMCFKHFRACSYDVKNGKSTMCGSCSSIKILTKHGDSNTRLHNIWTDMKRRRYDYKVSVCKKWNDYTVFKKWALINGYKDNLSIDRIENNKGYSPKNCRWATSEVQNNNKRKIQKNNKSGYEGVSLLRGKYQASIMIDGKQKYLGVFINPKDASEKYEYQKRIKIAKIATKTITTDLCSHLIK